MKAMVLERYDAELVLREVPDPRPGPDEILIAVRACGMCYTDIKLVTGQLGAGIHLPHIPGHEIAGEVVEVGSAVRGVGAPRVGDKGVVYCVVTCGVCEMCRTGRENLCLETRRLGFELSGGFAELATLPAVNFCPFSAEVPFWEMAILPDAVATPFHALERRARLRLGETVLIVGIGGLGIHAVQIAAGKGALVIAVDVNDEALELARAHGAHWTLNPTKEAPGPKIREITSGRGVDLVLEGVGRQATVSWSLPTLKKGGRCVMMGYDPVNPVSIPMLPMHNYEWTVCGTKVSTRQELQEVIRAVERRQIRPVVTRRLPLQDANQGLAAIRRGETQGRTVLVMESAR